VVLGRFQSTNYRTPALKVLKSNFDFNIFQNIHKNIKVNVTKLQQNRKWVYHLHSQISMSDKFDFLSRKIILPSCLMSLRNGLETK